VVLQIGEQVGQRDENISATGGEIDGLSQLRRELVAEQREGRRWRSLRKKRISI
jgi:hypothetical protein